MNNQAMALCFLNNNNYSIAFAAARVFLGFLEEHGLLYALRELIALAALNLRIT